MLERIENMYLLKPPFLSSMRGLSPSQKKGGTT